MASQQKNVGILAMEIYFPPACIQQVSFYINLYFSISSFFKSFIRFTELNLSLSLSHFEILWLTDCFVEKGQFLLFIILRD